MRRTTFALLVCALLAAATPGPASAAEAAPDTSGSAAQEPTVSPSPTVPTLLRPLREQYVTTSGVSGVCTFYGRVDYAHISTSSPTRAVQSHGGWRNGNCAATTANVTVGVMKKNTIGIFVDVGRLGKKTMVSDQWGKGAWAVAHYDCSSSSTHYFQSWVDVDLVGLADSINKQFSPPTQLACN